MTVIGSLCSGYGGLEMGAALALGDVEVAWHVEYDKWPSAVLAHHYPDVPNYGDLTTLDYDRLAPIDLLTSGYPCQPFSHAGKRRGKDDERHLWPYVADTIGALRPRHVLLENVAGHVSLGLDAVLWDLAALGYDARWGVVRAADAGAPHGRARVFIVATDADNGLRSAGQDRRGMGGEDRRARSEGDRQRSGHPRDSDGAADESGSAAAADSAFDGRERGGRARDGWAGPADSRVTPADASRDGRDEGRPEPARLIGGPHAPVRGHAAPDADVWRRSERPQQHRDATPNPADGSSRRGHADGHPGPVAWGVYAPAIRRWERCTGRPAPRPTEPGRRGERLSPHFVEWLMGLPAGWVTDVPRVPRNAQLKALGNGVVPQQAALALRLLAPELCAADCQEASA